MLIQLAIYTAISFTCIWLNSFWHRAILRRQFKKISKTFRELQDDWQDGLDDDLWFNGATMTAYEAEEARKNDRHSEDKWGLPPTAYEIEELRKKHRNN